jgi:hypothetical protein
LGDAGTLVLFAPLSGDGEGDGRKIFLGGGLSTTPASIGSLE